MKEKQKYIITIDEPCHEKWADMKTQTGGRFCGSCAKAVVDFTKLSDNEIIRILENANGKSLCGRFEKEQLNKIMVQTNAEKNNPALYKILAGLLLLASVETAVGQTTPPPKTTETISAPKNQIMGKIAIAPVISGTIVDENGKPVPGATVIRESTNLAVTTDGSGKFSTRAYGSEKLKISKEKYEETVAEVKSSVMKITLKRSKLAPEREFIMGDVSISAPQKPTYIIDGIFIENFEINTIDPKRIKSVNVLKDGPSVVRSNQNNEVIVIKTDLSKDEKGKLKIKTE